MPGDNDMPADGDAIPPLDPELEAEAARMRGILVQLLERTGGGPSRGDLEELAGLVRHIGRHGGEAARRVAAQMPEVPAPDLCHAADSAKAIFLGACLQLPYEAITDVVGLFREDLGVSQGFELGTWEEIADDPLLKRVLDDFMDVEGEYCRAGGEPEDARKEVRAPRKRKGRRAGGMGRRPAR